MNEQNDTPPERPTGRRQDAIDINDFVFAATGARVRRLTLPDGEHWFPAADVAARLGYSNTRDALKSHVDRSLQKSLGEISQGVGTADTLRKLAGHRLQRSMKMVNLKGLIQLVNGCTKPECAPFKAWVSEVVETVQRDGSYSLDPAPVQPARDGTTAYLMPQEVADAIVRLEERNIRADEELVVAQAERIEQMRRANDRLGRIDDRLGSLTERVGGVHDVLGRIADALDLIADRLQPPGTAQSSMTPRQLLATWRAKNLVVTDDVHAVAAYLAPALVRGPVHCRMEEVADRTGLTLDRVHDCVRMLIKRGCVRQTGVGAGGVPVFVLA
ncbi:Bro-N domain-containing protein [Streptomyces sp. Go40/10]|uniref:BRO-N domain-containing protein n=1 Tax=Streptomyces sp. Go40/10 TaxID=2825844 RepID=UPI001E46715A|nr:Bro-N domain-containing protein [Streptomyces sp. Go40/10]UFR03362.1 Bro-N domain-containing protein [Streptomyces sp. Go40/10]